jgi:hypothetical protein
MTSEDHELIEAWRAIALMVAQGIITRTATVDRLWEIATAHALVRALGEDRIQAIIEEAFAGADFQPLQEVA